MLEDIDTYYNEGDYKRALDSISALRVKYPSAIEERKKALVKTFPTALQVPRHCCKRIA